MSECLKAKMQPCTQLSQRGHKRQSGITINMILKIGNSIVAVRMTAIVTVRLTATTTVRITAIATQPL